MKACKIYSRIFSDSCHCSVIFGQAPSRRPTSQAVQGDVDPRANVSKSDPEVKNCRH
ncbi:hypothetical protein J6590_053398 [Homalodisca vitripennis]|nr:hypothetical protein J6590_053398 [Homalodisca vitripennis]